MNFDFETAAGGAPYDAVGGMDGADLRYMDESSVVVPSPAVETPSNSVHNSVSHPSPPSSPKNPLVELSAANLVQPATAAVQPLRSAPEATKPVPTVTFAPRPVNEVANGPLAAKNNNNAPAVNHVTSNHRTSVAVARDVSQSEGFDSISKDGTGDGNGRPASSSGASASAPSKKDIVRSIGKRIKGRRKKKDGDERQKSKSENRARKALRTISFILGAFVACWTPYHIFALVEGFCSEPPCINGHLYMFTYFLCYANSPMNPFCYALANQQFKKTFMRILRGDLHIT